MPFLPRKSPQRGAFRGKSRSLMSSRISPFSLSGLALAAAIFGAALLVSPIFARKSLASQNNSRAKQSAQPDTKADTKNDSKSAGNSSAAQEPAGSGAIEKRVEDFLRKWYAWGPDF